ncbi:MAG: heparan-alpha-glucosaminide N-acetyltransferase domain-containing protein [Cyclobacteriaceae bacterium]
MTENGSHQFRISSIDIARGLIMVIMALDHTRDYFHADAFVFDPANLGKTHTALFFTRWITHFCMPAFVLLAGVATRISLVRKSKKELSRYLFTRGLWMILLEIVVMRFAYFFNFYFDVTILSVLWLFGMCMILLSALIYLPNKVLLVSGLIMVMGHNLLDGVTIDPTSLWFATWTIYMRVGFLTVTPDVAFIISYPVIPWLGVMLVGYGIGSWYGEQIDSTARQKLLLKAGITCLVAFVMLRFINVYGDPTPWSSQQSNWFTFLSFINTTKYPVSLLFLLMTIGPLLILLSLLEKGNTKVFQPLNTIGRVPLFYFILHFYLIHMVALISYMIKTGKSFSEIDLHFAKSFGGITPEGGHSLLVVYFVWVAIVLIMYPLCKAYDRIKSQHPGTFLSYL